jgi:leucine dehydrogenase
MWNYESEEDALRDVLRLARGMTYKASACGLDLGGGKAVIVGDCSKGKSEKMLKKYGQFLNYLNGRYITAEDVGTNQNDMDIIRQETKYVVGTSNGSGDPSPYTAYGVFRGIKAAVRQHYSADSMKGIRVAVQGLGNVGYHLCRYLHDDGAELIVTDICKDSIVRAVGEFRAKAVDPDNIFEVECNIYSPCALGAVVNNKTIDRLKCEIIAGAANNVLENESHGDQLHRSGIWYIPDYIINAGGLINVAAELDGYDRYKVLSKVENIYDTVVKIMQISKEKDMPPYQAADLLAMKRINEAKSS